MSEPITVKITLEQIEDLVMEEVARNISYRGGHWYLSPELARRVRSIIEQTEARMAESSDAINPSDNKSKENHGK